MTQRRNSKNQGKRDVKSSVSKNGRSSESADASSGPGQSSGPVRSWFSLVLVLALVGLWSSMAVVYFDVVDYDSVLARAKEFRQNFTNVLQGKLSAYDSDGDGDFDLEDAKVLLGLNKDGGGGGGSEESAESSLEEMLSVLSDEGSDWLFGFFSFLFDVVTTPDDKIQGTERSLPDDKEPIRAERSLPDDKEPIRAERSLPDDKEPIRAERSLPDDKEPIRAERSLPDDKEPIRAERGDGSEESDENELRTELGDLNFN